MQNSNLPISPSNNITKAFEELENSFAEERAAFFNCLTKNQQLLVFCEVVNRLVKGEIEGRRSYRGILYEIFEFGTEAYSLAQISGFLELHNSISAEPINLNEFGSKLLALYGIEQTEAEVENKIREKVETIKQEF